jgi:UDP-N-acetylglucosamine:LPS N-acetylglucosamine transferase
LQARIDLHNQALLESEKFEREIRDKDLSLKELKTIIQQLEQDLQDKIQELEQNKQVCIQVNAEQSVTL